MTFNEYREIGRHQFWMEVRNVTTRWKQKLIVNQHWGERSHRAKISISIPKHRRQNLIIAEIEWECVTVTFELTPAV